MVVLHCWLFVLRHYIWCLRNTFDSRTTKAVASSVAALRWNVTTWLSAVAARYLPEVTWRNLHEWPQPMKPSAHLSTSSNATWISRRSTPDTTASGAESLPEKLKQNKWELWIKNRQLRRRKRIRRCILLQNCSSNQEGNCGWHVTTSCVKCPLQVSKPGQLSLPSLRDQ